MKCLFLVFVTLIVGASFNLLAGSMELQVLNDEDAHANGNKEETERVEEKQALANLRQYFEKIKLSKKTGCLSRRKKFYLEIENPAEFQTGCPVAAKKILTSQEKEDVLLEEGQCKGHCLSEYFALKKGYCADNNKLRFCYSYRKKVIQFRQKDVKELMDQKQSGLSENVLSWLKTAIPEKILRSPHGYAAQLKVITTV